MQFHLGTNASGGVSAHSSSYSCSMRSTQLRGPEDSAGERARGETEAKTPPSSACALGTLYNGGGGGGGGRQRRRKREAGEGGALTQRASSSGSSTSCAGVTCGQRASRELRPGAQQSPPLHHPAPPLHRPAPPPPLAVPGGSINAERPPAARRAGRSRRSSTGDAGWQQGPRLPLWPAPPLFSLKA